MSFAHLTLPTQHVAQTTAFLEETLGYARDPVPSNAPGETVWLNIGRGQQMHVFHVDNFAVSPFEAEFGRHVAVFYPRAEFEALKERLLGRGAELFEPLRATAVDRFFFREPVNGYVFEVIDQAREAL